MNNFMPGQIVYVIIRNPHVQGVASVQQAAVVNDPSNPTQLALFLYETYYPLNENVAVYQTEGEAEMAYKDAFGISENDEVDQFYG